MSSSSLVRRAIEAFLAGERPVGYRASQYWFVLGPDGELLPAKAVWSLATGVRGAKFNTKHAVRGLVDLGHSVIDIRHSHEATDLNLQVAHSLTTSTKSRRKRLKAAPARPKSRLTVVRQFIRNPDVIAEVLLRAKGKCERCRKSAPFTRYSDGTPYLEVHHRTQLSLGGEDTVINAIALCPNCHRYQHYGTTDIAKPA